MKYIKVKSIIVRKSSMWKILLCIIVFYSLFNLIINTDNYSSSTQQHDIKSIDETIDQTDKDIPDPPPYMSTWVDNGLPISTYYFSQNNPKLCSDGEGGAFIIWMDNRQNDDGGLYANRINSSGNKYWGEDGIRVNKGPMAHAVCLDGQGGVFIAWIEWDPGDMAVYVQRINASGIILWGTPVKIDMTSDHQGSIKVIPDGYYGAIVIWSDTGTGSRDLYAQRINSSGEIYWKANGIEVCNASNDQGYPDLCTDGDGGAIFTWEDKRGISGDSDIYAQRINKSGHEVWIENGIPICDQVNIQRKHDTISDGMGGAIIAWSDRRIVLNSDIYAQRINGSGQIYWEGNGTAICNAEEDQDYPSITTDGNNGAIIAWRDERDDGSNGDVYSQKVNSTGYAQWYSNGTAIGVGSQDGININAVSDGNGGAVIGWRNLNGLTPYAQIINSTGSILLDGNGIPLIVDQYYYEIWSLSACAGSPSNPGSAYFAWHHERTQLTADVYAQYVKLPSAPTLNPITPIIDTDGTVNLNWTNADFAIEYYIFRNTSPITSIGSLTPLGTTTQLNYTDNPGTNDIYYYGVIARGILGNSSISNNQYVEVKSRPHFINLTTDAGSPIDTDGDYNLTWNESPYTDNYSVYWDTSFINDVSIANLIASDIEELNYTINDNANGTYYYVIVAFNKIGNESSNCITVNVSSSPPLSFSLYTDAQSPYDLDGNYSLLWDESIYAEDYSIYWDTSFIVDVSSANLLTSGITSLDYSNTGNTNGIYFYRVVAFNGAGNRSSECISIEVRLFPCEFILYTNISIITNVQHINLTWSPSNYAENYSLYQSNENFILINPDVELIVKGNINRSFIIKGLIVGTYYFRVFAFNEFGNKSSNIIQIIVKSPSGKRIYDGDNDNEDFDILFLIVTPIIIGSLIAFSAGFIYIKKKKYRGGISDKKSFVAKRAPQQKKLMNTSSVNNLVNKEKVDLRWAESEFGAENNNTLSSEMSQLQREQPFYPQKKPVFSVYCDSCNISNSITRDQFYHFTCKKCGHYFFNFGYFCSFCNKIYPISKENYIGLQEPEELLCYKCNSVAKILKKIH